MKSGAASREELIAHFLETRHDDHARIPPAGNGLTVFQPGQRIPAELMQAVTIEMRQFESIFLHATARVDTFEARIFTMEEELPFAGHPLLGAACVLHEQHGPHSDTLHWMFEVSGRAVPVTSCCERGAFRAEMNQGAPVFGEALADEDVASLLAPLNLVRNDLVPDLPVQVVSTGLPYLILPLARGLERTRIVGDDFEVRLGRFGAKFVYVLDVPSREGRTWDNRGLVEDVATGSAAGPAAAYLVRHRKAKPNSPFVIQQGRFAGRPSQLFVRTESTGDVIASVHVMGHVSFVGRGTLDLDL